VDGLTCGLDSTGQLACDNSNAHASGNVVTAFHLTSRCVSPDLDHTWAGSHREANFDAPNAALLDSPNDGFVRVNEALYGGSPHEDATMGYYTQEDLPFYYDLARKFAINDRYFSSLIGPTLPNRFYLLAATSFGHVASGDSRPPGGFKPAGGTIFDLLDDAEISWANYSQASWQAALFRDMGSAPDSH
jgi:phospholipase C